MHCVEYALATGNGVGMVKHRDALPRRSGMAGAENDMVRECLKFAGDGGTNLACSEYSNLHDRVLHASVHQRRKSSVDPASKLVSFGMNTPKLEPLTLPWV